MKSRPSLFILILIGLAGVLLIAVVISLVLAAFFPVSRVTTSSEAGEATLVEVTLPPESAATATSPAETAPAETAPGSSTIVPPGFVLFQDEALGFSLARPADWQEGERPFEFSRLFYDIKAPQVGVGPLPELYVTFNPAGDSRAEGSYGYMSHDAVRSFQALAVGAAQPIVPDAFPPEAFTFTRLSDRQVAGQPALVIENTGVWEAPLESTERRVIVVTPAGTYLIASIYETPEELRLFEQVLDSFAVLP